MVEFISAIAFADITVEFYGYFLRWSGWQVICMGMLSIAGCCYFGFRMGSTIK